MNMIEFIHPSNDYVNDWHNTEAWAILSIRRLREGIDKVIVTEEEKLFYPLKDREKIYEKFFPKNYEAIEAVALVDSLRNLDNPNGFTSKDADTVLTYYARELASGDEEMHPKVKRFVLEAFRQIANGVDPNVAFKIKKQGTGAGNSIDEINPPEYIFVLTALILKPEGDSLHKKAEFVFTEGVSGKHMCRMFKKHEMWRNQGYVNWRMEQQIKNKTNDVKWTKGQKKNLKKYWGWEIN